METTIAAISTAMSASGIGIVRISGEDAMEVISRIYRSKGGKKRIKEDAVVAVKKFRHFRRFRNRFRFQDPPTVTPVPHPAPSSR